MQNKNQQPEERDTSGSRRLFRRREPGEKASRPKEELPATGVPDWDDLDAAAEFSLEMEVAAGRMPAKQQEPLPEAPQPGAGELPPQEELPRFQGFLAEIAEDNMSATLTLLPPQEGETCWELPDLEMALAAQGIVRGVQEEVLRTILKGKIYQQPFVIAMGREPGHSQDGYLEELFPRLPRPNPTAPLWGESTPIYVEKGSVICHVHQPPPATDGYTVQGRCLAGEYGEPVALPQGENLCLSPEKDALLAQCSGYLCYEEGRFCVLNRLSVEGKVDGSAGSIVLDCDLLLQGDVGPGALIQVKGDVTICGIMSGGVVEAGGNLYAGDVTGGRLVANKNLVCGAVENAVVQAEGDIVAQRAIDSWLVSNHAVRLQGEGCLVGGRCEALALVEAVTVGSADGATTIVTLGNSFLLQQQQEALKQEMKTLWREQDMLEQEFVAFQEEGPLTEERQQLLAQRHKQRMANMVRLSRLQQNYQSVGHRLEEVRREIRFSCQTAYPGTQIRIGTLETTLQQKEEDCLFRAVNDEIIKEP